MKTYKHSTLGVAQLPWRMTIISGPLKLATHIQCDTEEDLLAMGFVEVEEKELPMSWDELGSMKGFYVNKDSELEDVYGIPALYYNKNVRPTEELASASLAMSQLMQLRDVWREGSIEKRYFVYLDNGNDKLDINLQSLSFETTEKRDLFQATFADLIKTALPLFYS